jgi:hypothetical protein
MLPASQKPPTGDVQWDYDYSLIEILSTGNRRALD